MTGDPFIRLNITYGFYKGQDISAGLLYYPKAILAPLGQFGVYYIVLFGLVYLAVKKQLKPAVIPLIWFVTGFLYWEFGSMSVTGFVPIFKEARFLTQLTIPACLILAHFLSVFAADEGKALFGSKFN